MTIDTNTVGMVSAIVTPLGLVLVAGINYWTSIAASNAASAAQSAARNAASKLEDIADTTHLVHSIVNSRHTRLLQLTARLAARVAKDNPDDAQAQADARAAVEAIGESLEGVEVGP